MNRASLFASVPLVLNHLKKQRADQGNLFGAPTVEELALPELPEWSEDERLWRERKALGAFLTGHPVIPRREKRPGAYSHRCRESHDMLRSGGARIVVAGLVRRYDRWARIAFLTLEDETGALDVIAFNDEADRFASMLMVGAILAVKLKPRFDNDRSSLQLIDAHRLGHFRAPAGV